jgi:hypothetical protein
MRLVSHNVTTAENSDEMARSKSGSSSCFLNSTQEGLGVGRRYDGSSLLNVPKLHHAVEIVTAELLGDVIDELFGFGCDRSPVITLRLSIFILKNSKHFRLGIDGLAKGSRTRVVRCAYHKVAFSEHTLAHYAESLRKFLAIALRPLFEVGFLFEESTKLCKHVDFGTRFFCISVWHIVIIRALGNVLVGLEDPPKANNRVSVSAYSGA